MPTTAPGLVTDTFADVTPDLIATLGAVLPAVIGVGLIFWAGRLVLRKLGFGGKVAKI